MMSRIHRDSSPRVQFSAAELSLKSRKEGRVVKRLSRLAPHPGSRGGKAGAFDKMEGLVIMSSVAEHSRISEMSAYVLTY